LIRNLLKLANLVPAALELARIVNTAMIEQQPTGWLRYLEKYSTSDVIFTDLLNVQDKSSMIGSVLLKQLSAQQYFVRPGQHLGTDKFSSKSHHQVYCWIKALKTILDVDLRGAIHQCLRIILNSDS
jgi:hypothetical protein